MAPTPPFVGAPLDPPLRSRFSARAIDALPLAAQVQIAQRALPSVVALPAWRSVLALERFCALQQDASSGGALVRVPPFPSTAVWFAARSLALLPHQSARHLVARLWPLDQLACSDTPHLWQALSPNLGADDDSQLGYRVVGAARRSAASRTVALQFARTADGAVTHVDVAGGLHGTPTLHAPAGVVVVGALADCLAAMLADAAVGGGDLCVLAAEGCGKSVMCAWFAQALGYGADEVVHVDLFKEVSTRDLFMRRDTNDSGDTVWQMQPLVQAVQHGRLALLDGAHRPPPGVLAALTELLLDRQLALDDGTRILCADAYDAVQFREALSDEQMLARGWRRAHEAFRVVLCGNTASSHAEERAAAHSWLTADLIAGLRCHVLPELTAPLLRLVVRGACGAALPEVVVEDLACVVELQRRLVRPAPLVPPAIGAEEERRLSRAPQSAPAPFTAASLPLLSLRAALRARAQATAFGVHTAFDAADSAAAAAAGGCWSARCGSRTRRRTPPRRFGEALAAHIAATPLAGRRRAAPERARGSSSAVENG
jgi:hypothetical protein